MGGGAVTSLLLSRCLTPHEQGYFFTFMSLVTLQVLTELGLTQVIVQFASHEWSHLHLDERGQLQGPDVPRRRLLSLAHLALRWFAAASAVTLVLLLGGGWWLFAGRENQAGIAWQGPWVVLCLGVALKMLLLPLWALLEGCNQVEGVYRFRLLEGVLNMVIYWTLLLTWGGLWPQPVGTLVTFAWAVVALLWWFGPLVRAFVTAPAPDEHQAQALRWRDEIWPVQWRTAVSYCSGAICLNAITPIAFQALGSVEAGRLGLTMTLVTAVGSIAVTWITTRVPRYGMLVAQQAWAELDQHYLRTRRIALAILLALGALLFALIEAVHRAQLPIATRLLPPLPTLLLILGMICLNGVYPMSAYLRAFRREPLLGISLVQSITLVALSLILSRSLGVMGMALGYLGVYAASALAVTRLFHRLRREWRPVDAEVGVAM